MASPIVKGNTFGTTDTVTSTTLNNIVDNSTFKGTDGNGVSFSASSGGDLGTCVAAGGLEVHSTGQLQIKDNGVTLAKMATQADQTVLGNVSGGTAVPTAVPIVGASGILVNNDSLGTDDTKGATQGNIKAYVDASSTDGFTPTSYTGGESVTLPNGLIMKWGEINPANGSNSVSYGSSFPTETINIQYARFKGTHNTYDDNNAVTSKSASGFTIHVDSGTAYGTLMWQAIGR